MAQKIKIIDTNFSHSNFTTDYQESKFIEWDRNLNIKDEEIVFITDNSILNNLHLKSKNKIGMLIEPRSVNPYIYEWILSHNNLFNYILTYDKIILEKCNNSIFYPHGGCWIKKQDHSIYNKSKILSIICSNKTETQGHQLRHLAIQTLQKNNISIDLFGRGYNPIPYKLEAFKDYAFSLVIENMKTDFYFTEKLIDAFVTGTVPIYWGCPSIGKFFNLDGMLIFENIEELLMKIDNLSLDKYHNMMPAIYENFEKCKEYLIAEDWIYNHTNIFK